MHVFICDSENCMEKLFGDSFLGKSHVSYLKEVFGSKVAIPSGWSASHLRLKITPLKITPDRIEPLHK